ncbi:bifunctional DNA primase/polymerase, partial [Streptomyces sp. MCAF7]
MERDRKKVVDKDITGEHGKQRTAQESVDLQIHYQTKNIALRMSAKLVGIDVDDYDGKNGAATLAEYEAKWGPLPPTVYSTARGAGPSGIRLYRLRTPGPLVTRLEPGIEIAQWHHRYVSCWPSIHPETKDVYQWYTGEHVQMAGVPHPIDDVALLPQRWETGLRELRDEVKAHQPNGPIETLEEPPAGLVAAIEVVAEQIASL